MAGCVAFLPLAGTTGPGEVLSRAHLPGPARAVQPRRAGLGRQLCNRLAPRASAADGAGSPSAPYPTKWAPGEFKVPTMLNNCPHPREVRQFFYEDQKQIVAAIAAGKTRMKVKMEFPELNVDMDVYRIGTLLDGVWELVAALTQDGKRVKICVQGSMGQGKFTAMPLQLSGVRRILDMMDFGEATEFVRFGGISAADTADDTDVFIVLAPQNITGYSVLPYMKEMGEAAGERPIVLINPRLVDIPSANNVMQVRGREDRLAFVDSYEEVYHFRLLYRKPFAFPIYGALRYSFGANGWEVYKRLGKMQSEVYRFSTAFPTEPNAELITVAIQKDVGKVDD